MLAAHLPAGYLLARGIWRVNQGTSASSSRRTSAYRWVVIACLVGSILPDFDLIWFYAIDARAFHHHLYWPHMPAFWAVLAVPIWLAGKYLNQPLAALGFLLAIGLHLFLDSLVGGVAWLWPVSAHLFPMAEVPATHANWILSFVFHWSFLLELLIIFSALFLAISQNRKPPHA